MNSYAIRSKNQGTQWDQMIPFHFLNLLTLFSNFFCKLKLLRSLIYASLAWK